MIKTKNSYQIGEVAKSAGISVDTIRFYEKEKLIQAPERSMGGFRMYDPSVIDRLHFIKKAQSFGLTLGEVREIMEKSNHGLGPCCNHVSKVFERKLEELEENIRDLQKVKRNLKALLKSWIPIEVAKKQRYVVCPQIEVDRKKTKGGNVMSKRKVEVFTSGCYLCEETVSLVKELACPNCDVSIYNLQEPCDSKECIDKAKEYGVASVPTVVIDGKIVECCQRDKISREALMSAGLGQTA